MLLNCHTYYSLCYGTLSVNDLLAEVKQKGYKQFVIADINNTSASVEIVKRASEENLRPILGIDFRNGIVPCYTGIAQNQQGSAELNAHLSSHQHRNIPFAPEAPEFANAYIVYPFASYTGWKLRENEFIGVTLENLSTLSFRNTRIAERKMVVWHPLTFRNKRDFNTHRLLRAVDTNVLLSRLDETQQASRSECILHKAELYAAFQSYPEIIQTTERILHACMAEIEFGKFANKNLRYYTGSAEGDRELLRNESINGLAYRYENPSDEILKRLDNEIDVIVKMGFASYFLINWDIVRYAQRKDYYYVGRGSGSNSLIAYLLRITDVDPVELDLYFERFINLYRSTPPDFDIDFSWTDRDAITGYIFNRFGENGQVALLGSYTTFQSKGVVRELGKVFGLPPREIDVLQRITHPSQADDIGKLVLNYSEWIHGFPSHLSIHASGILISEEPITQHTATFLPPKGFPTTHFSMLEAEDIGLFKFDILSQRGLGKIKDTLGILKVRGDDVPDIHNTAAMMQDPKVASKLRVGNAIACFYIESPAMRMLLCKLQAGDYLRLVAASSIIRPGVSKSGMMREYILRYRNVELREKARNELPEYYSILSETYGVMVYQEDVIKVAHYFAGLTLAEADYLRRGMSWKFKQRNEFFRVREQFFRNCEAKGHPLKTVTDIWNQIESFANFAFSKGHSASYAVESYQALFLKTYYPIEYLTATLNNGGGFYRPEIYLHEAHMHGATIEAPCINVSRDCYCMCGTSIYLSFSMVAELESQTVTAILQERDTNGAFSGLDDFLDRVPVSLEQTRILIRAGAFRFTGKTKCALLWDAHLQLSKHLRKLPEKELFRVPREQFEIPQLQENWVNDAFDEMELFGFTLQLPFYLLKNEVPSRLRAKDLPHFTDRHVSIVGYLVTLKNTYTSKGERMYFGTFLDMDGCWIDTVHFAESTRKFPFRGKGCYLIKGKVLNEFDHISIDVTYTERLPYLDREHFPSAERPEIKPLKYADC